MRNFVTAKPGQILIPTLIVMSVLLVLTGALITLTNAGHSLTLRSVQGTQALNLAEAGIETAIRQLNTDGVVDETETALGKGTFVVRDLTQTGDERIIESTGYIPNAANPRVQKKVRVTMSVSGESVEFFYGIQVDEGGLEMGNNAAVNGNVYTNGSITGNNGATITGDAVVAGGAASVLDQKQEVTNATQDVGRTSTETDVAQSFVPSQSEHLTKIGVYLNKVGTPSNLTVRIMTDNNNKPSRASIANAAIMASSVGATGSWIEVSFSSPPSLNQGSRYWLVLDSSANASNYYQWSKDIADSYPNGKPMGGGNWQSVQANWHDLGGDLAFRTYLGGTATEINNVDVGGTARGNTLKDLTVTGDAYFQTLINTTVNGIQYPNSPDPARADLPISDGVIADWKAAAEAGGTIPGDYTLDNHAAGSLGPKKITGDLFLDNGAILTVTGTLWVQGEIRLSNVCQVKLDPGYADASGIILADGKIKIDNKCAFSGSGQDGSYTLLLSTLASNDEEVIEVDNNSSGVIYYAGKGPIEFNQNALAKEATAWQIEMENESSITYESGLQNVFFTNGPGGGWGIVSGTWQEL